MKYSWSESFRSPSAFTDLLLERWIADGEVVRPSDVQFRIGKGRPAVCQRSGWSRRAICCRS